MLSPRFRNRSQNWRIALAPYHALSIPFHKIRRQRYGHFRKVSCALRRRYHFFGDSIHNMPAFSGIRPAVISSYSASFEFAARIFFSRNDMSGTSSNMYRLNNRFHCLYRNSFLLLERCLTAVPAVFLTDGNIAILLLFFSNQCSSQKRHANFGKQRPAVMPLPHQYRRCRQ